MKKIASAPVPAPGVSAPIQESFQIVQDVFGEHPRDVLLPAGFAIDVLDQLHALFFAIEQLSDQDTIKKLVGLGKFVACDSSEHIGILYEDMRASLDAFESSNGSAA
ncbi:hypothetical protein AGMMS50256_30760 [Betaproteobacteria bacterium]|nr:hypothetical protein AGMMS50256_30760 [Betaproteobacteria bacterium]